METEEKIVNPSEEKEDGRIRYLDKWFADSMLVEEDFYRQAVEDEKFYLGDQWDASDRRKLEQEERPALTYNNIFPIVNLVNGYHRQNRQDIKVMNVRGGSQGVAEVLTAIIKHTKQTKNGDWEISHAHLLGCITGKSYIGINIDYDDDLLNGQLFYEFNHCRDILFDPFGSRYDLADRDFMFRSAWMPISKIRNTYKLKGKDTLEVLAYDRKIASGVETFNYEDATKYQIQEKQDIENYRYRVKECWWKEYQKQKFLINIQNGQVHNVSQLKKGNIERIIFNNPVLRMVERTKPIMHLSQYVGRAELYHTVNPLGGMTNFPVVGFFPYFIDGKCQGIVTQLKDAQREHNKRISQALHHLNSTANSGFTADADAVEDWDDFVEHVAHVGYVKKIKTGKRFEKDHPTELSRGHVELALMGANAMRTISNVNADLLGQDNTETVSGIAIARRQAQGLLGTEIIHDNLRLTLKILGDRSIEAIQKSGAYSREEVLRLVVDEQDTPMAINQKVQGAERALNDLTVGRYETVVTTSIQTPTARFANYMALLEAIKIGVPIPPQLLAKASDWPYKDEIIQGIQQQMAAQAEAKKAEMADKDKDRQLEIMKIREKTSGDMLKDAQKAQMDAVKEFGKGDGKDRSNSKKD